MTIGTMSERLMAEVETMAELVAQIPGPTRMAEPTRKAEPLPKEGRSGPDPAVRATSEADFRALEALLTKLDPTALGAVCPVPSRRKA